MKRARWNEVNAYMTIEAALVMSVVITVYVFLIDCMLLQYERCVEELDAAGKCVMAVESETSLYDIKSVNPMTLLRMQREVIQKNQKEEEKEE